jgi:exonuclease SbcC
MKPIQLTWSGLQSYREKQEIDFTLLCDAGVFGIFGPTGSGKSTILDAITLALYGKVERASNGTQGILNQAESMLSVSFTFELSHADGAKRYRVDRQFKRAADVSVLNSMCRLIEVQSEQDSIVIADKAGEVNAQVLEILGLSMQDFSRAVILPQGKFAEFLSLKGADRRQMLQRLFHLEHYGDVLNARVSQRTKETDIAVKQIIAEQQGLGDASEQALEVLKQQLEESQQFAKQQRIHLQQATKQWEEIKVIRGLQLELQGVETKRAELVLQEGKIAEQELQLKLAEQAEQLRHFLEEYEETNLQARDLLLQQEQMGVHYNEAVERTQQAVSLHTQARQELTLQDAPLQVKLEQLKQAIVLEQDIQRGRLLEKELLEKLELCNGQLLLSQMEIVKKREIHTRAVKKQAELNDQLKALEVKAEDRQSLQNALRDKHTVDTTLLKVNELQQQVEIKQQQLLKERTEEAEIADQLSNNRSRLTSLLTSIEGHALTYSQYQLKLESLKINVMNAIQKQKKIEKENELERLAMHLASQLQEQQPCPVCGSKEHPSPVHGLAEQPQAAVVPLLQELELLELLLSKVQQLQFMFHKQSLEQIGLQQKLSESLPSMAKENLAGIQAAAAFSMDLQAPIHIDSIHILEEEYESLSEALGVMDKQLVQWSEDIKQAMQQKEHFSQQQMQASAQIQALSVMLNSLEANFIEAQKEYKLQHDHWKSTYLLFHLETIQIESEKLSERDKAAEQLRTRLEQSIPFIEETVREIEQRLQENTELDKRKIQLETEHRGLNQLNNELDHQFRLRWEDEIPEGGTITGQVHETEQLLLRLREMENQTKQQMENDQKALNQLDMQYNSLKQAADSAQQAYKKAEQFWQKALLKTTFTAVDQVKDALLSRNQIEIWLNEIKQHREQEARLTNKLEELTGKLNGQSASEILWLETELILTTARDSDERALQALAKAERDLEQLQSKHLHWCALEQNLAKLKMEFADLSKLQNVLRGNAFVEYIAEEQLIQVCRAASERLGQLTRQRYALEVDSGGGFVIRDDANGGVKRPVGTLSGGETFLTSLALALALSAQIQLSGQYPLEFFFLDEGFGTLDPDLLETVVEALEKLHIDRLTVGIISHVPELKARLPRKLIVESAESGGRGSRVFMENM